MEKPKFIDYVCIGLLAWLLIGDGAGVSLPFVTPKPTAVTYVHDEKAALPSGVLAALDELNTKGLVATAVSDDTTDGEGQVPDQYKATIPAAKAVGIPALVVQAGERVLKTVKAPTTKAQILEAAGQ